MKILLPPSEGKTFPETNSFKLDLASLLFEDLSPERRLIIDALAEISSGPDALTKLKVGASLGHAVAANINLEHAPTAPAHRVYTGVLYQGLDYPSLNQEAATWADSNILVSSALFGLLQLADPIPAYRLSMDTNMGSFRGTHIGGLATYWRKVLNRPFSNMVQGEVIVDARSTSYLKATPTDPALTAKVDVFMISQGKLKKVSHFAKHYRGVLAGKLAAAAATGKVPQSLEELYRLTEQLLPEYTVELFPGKGAKEPSTLALITED